jgi:lipopolysaccharide export system protein LptA
MSKQTVIQFFLFFIIVLLCVFLFKSYFNNKKTKTHSEKTQIQTENTPETELKSNLMYEIKYTSKEKFGDIYIVEAEEGSFKDGDIEKIIMKNVTARINIKNSSTILILAENAIYDKKNYNTNFYENVIMTQENNVINADKFDLTFDTKMAIISGNIIYKNLNTKMIADKIEMDLITKKSKIFMNDKEKKIKIITIN